MKPEVLKPEAPQPAPRGTASVNARLTVLRGTASVNARLTVLLDRPCSVAQLLHILECDGHLRRQIAARLDDFKPTTGVTTRPQRLLYINSYEEGLAAAADEQSEMADEWAAVELDGLDDAASTDPKPPQPKPATLADRQAQAVGFRDDVELRQMAQQEEARIASSPGKASKSGQPMRAKRSAGKPASVSAKPAA